MSPTFKQSVASATLKLYTEDGGTGQAVLIEGGIVLTAAHCVPHYTRGGMTLGDYCLVRLSSGGEEFRLSVRAVEPVSDVAVLDPVGLPAELCDERWCFEDLVERTLPVKINRAIATLNEQFPIWIYRHDGTWIDGTARRTGRGVMWCATLEGIECGTSGGPIVNERGELVGIVSTCPPLEAGAICDYPAPCLPLALPSWVMHEMGAA